MHVFPRKLHFRRVESYGTAVNQMQSLSTVDLNECNPSVRRNKHLSLARVKTLRATGCRQNYQ